MIRNTLLLLFAVLSLSACTQRGGQSEKSLVGTTWEYVSGDESESGRIFIVFLSEDSVKMTILGGKSNASATFGYRYDEKTGIGTGTDPEKVFFDTFKVEGQMMTMSKAFDEFEDVVFLKK